MLNSAVLQGPQVLATPGGLAMASHPRHLISPGITSTESPAQGPGATKDAAAPHCLPTATWSSDLGSPAPRRLPVPSRTGRRVGRDGGCHTHVLHISGTHCAPCPVPSPALHSAISTGQEKNPPLVSNPQSHGFSMSHILLCSAVAPSVTPGGRDVCAMPAAPWGGGAQPHFSQLHTMGLVPKPVRGRRPQSPFKSPHLL